MNKIQNNKSKEPLIIQIKLTSPLPNASMAES